MYNKDFDNNSGFTLIEIIASIALLALVITLLLPIFPQILQWTGNTEKELTASNLIGQVAYDVKDQVQSIPYAVESCELGKTYKNNRVEHVNYYSVNNVDYIGEYEILCKEKIELKSVGLYRAKIKVYEKNQNLISESYTYIKSEEQP
ncbi:prepilin-type N-terminal cleavage/methylation domain-containing protein [Oceanobacillus picturae]|uniref:prepilin-type N-terminal cleavage/methylation domain-containing protein n=1 Tax=Oceanobacillus picturae TaxID=171693 RepID=UPI00362E494C